MIDRLSTYLAFVVLFLVSVTLTLLPQNHACADEFKATDINATNINLVNVHKIENGGYAPKFSPDGKQILYSKDTKRQQGMDVNTAWHALWIMGVDGKNKKKLFQGLRFTIRNGDRGAWSPDGKRIAYCDYSTPSDGLYIQPYIFIYDIKTKKKYKITQVDLDYCADNASITWSTDAEEILLYNSTKKYWTRTIIELETLNVIKEEDVDVEVINSRMEKYSFVKFPNVSLAVAYPDLYHGINEADGLWAANTDQNFERPLMKGVRGFDMAPDLKKIVFSSDSGIYVANVGVLKNLPPRTFHAEIGTNDLLAETRIGSTSIQEREKEVANGNVFGTIYRPKINPLNNRVIGPDGLPKAFARLTNVSRTHATVNVISEVYPVAKGDVISDVYVVGQGNKFAQSYWRLLEPASTNHINEATTTQNEATTENEDVGKNEPKKNIHEIGEGKKFDGYKEMNTLLLKEKKYAFLPSTYKEKSVAEQMDRINWAVAGEPSKKAGWTVISVKEIEDYLGSEFSELGKDPQNARLLKKIADKFGIVSFIYCRVDDWRYTSGSFLRFNNPKIALSYFFISAKTFKTMSQISGSDSSNDKELTMSDVNKALLTMAVPLAAELIKEL